MKEGSIAVVRSDSVQTNGRQLYSSKIFGRIHFFFIILSELLRLPLINYFVDILPRIGLYNAEWPDIAPNL
jgi:hypothetical protein